MSQIRKSLTERGRHWRQLIEACGKSGLTQAEFCRRRGLSGVTFAWWKRRLRAAEIAGPTERVESMKRAGRFVEVRMAGAGVEPGYEIMLGSGRSIRVPSRFDPQALSRLIAAVESC